MLKSIMWYLVLGFVVYTINIFGIAFWTLIRYKMDFVKAHKWSDLYGEIYNNPWLGLCKRLKLNGKQLDLIQSIVYVLTWPYAMCVSIYISAETNKEFENKLKEEGS